METVWKIMEQMEIKTECRPNTLSCACSVLASLSHFCDPIANIIATGNVMIRRQMFSGHHPQLTIFFYFLRLPYRSL